MRLLIVTQTVDTQDQLLGFFVGWIKAFSKHCSQIHVFCLNTGTYDFSDNVHVHCLGKSEGKGKLVWLYRLLTYSWRLRSGYDNVFVHMNAIHVVFAGLLWRLLGKKIGFWYTHPTVDLKLRLAEKMTHLVFTGSANSFGISTEKKNVMGQGVDPAFFHFKERVSTVTPALVVVGRISPIKNVGIAIEVLKEMRRSCDATLNIVGGPSGDSDIDEKYLAELKLQVQELQLESYVTWHGPKDATGVQEVLQESDVFVHTSLTHSADKTLPEAMASGLYVVSSNRAYKDDLPEICFKEPEVDEYVASINAFIQMSENEQDALRQKLRTCVEEKHSLGRLAENILGLY